MRYEDGSRSLLRLIDPGRIRRILSGRLLFDSQSEEAAVVAEPSRAPGELRTSSPEPETTAGRRSVRLALVGSSPWGRRILRRLHQVLDVDSVHAADAEEAKLEPLRKRLPGIETTVRGDDLIDNPEIDIVVIGSRSGNESALIERALESRKHVLVRGPLAWRSSGAGYLIRLARKKARLLVTADELLFSTGLQTARKWIESGELGDIRSVQATVHLPGLLAEEDARSALPREIAILNYLMGSPPDQVALPSGLPLTGPADNEGSLVAFLRYDRRTTVNLSIGPGSTSASRHLLIVGEKSEMSLSDPGAHVHFQSSTTSNGNGNCRRPDGKPQTGRLAGGGERSRASLRLARHFVECLDSGHDSPVNGVKPGFAVVRTLEALDRSRSAAGAIESVALEALKEAPEEAEPPRIRSTRRPRWKLRKDPRETAAVVRVDTYAEMIGEITRAWERGEGVWIVSWKLEWLMKRMRLRERTADGLPRVWFGPARRGSLDRLATRLMNITVSGGALVLASPFWLLLTAIIKLDRGPVFYVSTRVGKSQNKINFIKFRSMVPENDDASHVHLMETIISGEASAVKDANGNPLTKDPGDERVTRIGRVLRKTSLDEAPQFLHVLFRKLAIVGPRPPIPYEVDFYKDWMKARFAGDMGITGLWQVNGRHEVPFEDQVVLDIYYLANRSFWMDVGIMARTPAVMAFGKGGC